MESGSKNTGISNFQALKEDAIPIFISMVFIVFILYFLNEALASASPHILPRSDLKQLSINYKISSLFILPVIAALFITFKKILASSIKNKHLSYPLTAIILIPASVILSKTYFPTASHLDRMGVDTFLFKIMVGIASSTLCVIAAYLFVCDESSEDKN